jgi:hypothetical protein
MFGSGVVESLWHVSNRPCRPQWGLHTAMCTLCRLSDLFRRLYLQRMWVVQLAPRLSSPSEVQKGLQESYCTACS